MIMSLISKVKVKLFLFLGLVSLSALILISCSGGGDDVPASKQGTEKNPYTINWYTVAIGQQRDMPMVLKKANEYLRKKIGVELDITVINFANYNQKMGVNMISGGDMDLVFTCAWANNYLTNVSIGTLHPMNELLEKYGQGIKKALSPAFLEGPKVDGELYAIACNKEVAQQSAYRFNAKFLKELGFKISDFKPNAGLESLRSIIPYFKVAKEKLGPKGITTYAYWGNQVYVLQDQNYLQQDISIPGAVKMEEGNFKVFNQYESKEVMDYFELYHELFNKGYIPGSAATVKNNMSLVLAEKIAVDNQQYQPCADVVWSETNGYPMVSFPGITPITTNQSVMGAMVGIVKTSKRPDLCMKFLNLLNTDVYLRNLLNYGIEGVHYKKTAPNRIKYLPAHSNYIMPDYTLGNEFITYLLPKDPETKWEQFKAWNASAKESQILGFHPNLTPVQTEFAAILNVVHQYKADLFTGAVDPKVYVPKLLKALDNAGVKKYLAEMQKQLNEWVKNVKDKEKK